MDEWAKNLWNNNKIVFFLLIPVILLIFFRNVIIDLLIKDSRKIGNEAEEKDRKLSQDETKANTQANQIIADADKKSENKPEVGEDWNKK